MNKQRKSITIKFKTNVSIKVNNDIWTCSNVCFGGPLTLHDSGKDINVVKEEKVYAKIAKKHISTIYGENEMLWDKRHEQIIQN